MFEKKECWNICCICWEINPEQCNCSADDLNPDLCLKSSIDLRSILDGAKEICAKENKTLPIKEIIQHLKDIRNEIEEKWVRNGPIPGKERLDNIIIALEKR